MVDVAKSVVTSSLLHIYKNASTPVDSIRVPIIIKECIRGMEEKGIDKQGIFRVSGNGKRISQLLVDFDTPPSYGLGQYPVSKLVPLTPIMYLTLQIV
jgi:hypothetical protein